MRPGNFYAPGLPKEMNGLIQSILLAWGGGHKRKPRTQAKPAPRGQKSR